MDGDEEFRLQLEMEEKEKQKKEYESSHSYTDPNDGTVYVWDMEKKAWFPKIDDDFIAAYQANYGFTENSSTKDAPSTMAAAAPSTTVVASTAAADKQPASQQAKPAWQKKLDNKRKAAEAPQGWFDVEEQHNTNVYVSGLPTDITDEEFAELMGKCGIIMKDPTTQALKIKLYRDESGKLKGDGRCCYVKVESVDMALCIIDESVLRDSTIKVERAQFTMKGQYDPTKKPKKKGNKKKLKKMQEKLFDWRPDRPTGTRFRHEKTVIIKNMFDPKEFEKAPEMILDYTNDLREECAKFGSVKKVTVYDRNPEGVASIAFGEAEEADACIAAMNGRWFSQRQLQAASWDGKTKYLIEETETEAEKRLKDWEKYLESGENKDGGAKETTASSAVTPPRLEQEDE